MTKMDQAANTRPPEDLEEATQLVLEMLSEEEKQAVKEGLDLLPTYHHSLGRTIRNAFKLWDETSILFNWFHKELGLWHADDMSGIIMNHVQASLRGEEYDVSAQAQHYLDYWSRSRAAERGVEKDR